MNMEQQPESNSNTVNSSQASGSHACPHPGCTRSYGRSEHLARHLASHEGLNPFVCDFCKKSFSRKDVLVRHQKSHMEDGAGSGRRSAALRKGKKACDACKLLKARCDGLPTCSRCSASSKRCTYGIVKTRSGSESTTKMADQPMDVDFLANLSAAQENMGIDMMANNGPLDTDNFAVNESYLSHFANGTLQQAFNATGANAFIPQDQSNTQYQTPLSAHAALPDQSTSQVTGGNALVGLSSGAVLDQETPSELKQTSTFPINFDFNSLLFGTSTSPQTNEQPEDMLGNFDLSSLFAHSADNYSGLLMPSQSEPQASSISQVYADSTWNDLFSMGSNSDTGGDVAISADAGSGLQASPDVRDRANPRHAVQEHTNDPATRAKRGPPLNHGLQTRPTSPSGANEPEEDREWLTSWDPRSQKDPESTAVIDVGQIPENDSASPHPSTRLPPLTEPNRLSILELLHFAEVPGEVYHYLYVRFSRISLKTLDHFLQKYYECVHPYIPFYNLATMNTKGLSGFLLAAMVSLGAQFSHVSGAKSYSTVLGDLCQRSIGNVVTANNALARDIQLWQAMMLWTLLRYTGVRRLMELTDVFRNSFTVPLGRMHIFDGQRAMPAEVNDPNTSLHIRWKIWQAYESRQRTGYAAFLADAEFTIFLNRPNLILCTEMQSNLPCADALWEATSETAWQAKQTQFPILAGQAVPASSILNYGTNNSELIQAAKLSSFASTALVQLVHIALWNFRQAGQLSQTMSKLFLMDVKRTLIAIAGGPNEFVVAFHSASYRPGWKAFAILYHQAHLSLRIPLNTMMSIAGRTPMPISGKDTTETIQWLISNPVQAREMAMHAGQCLRILRDGNLEATADTFALFYCGIALYLFTCANAQQESAGSAYEIHLDTGVPSAVESHWVDSGSAIPVVAGIKLDVITARTAILKNVIDTLKTRDTWGLVAGLANVLQNLLSRV